MQTQINCPQCQSPVPANIFQIVDIDREPAFKQLLMNGQLNAAQCPSCGWVGQVASPMVYHESAHDLLLTFVPMELNMPYAEQEQLVGRLVNQVVESVPAEKRRAYLLQPQQMMRWQTLLETVLETEGITKEMIARQRDQSMFLRELLQADDARQDELLAEKPDLIDETVISMVNQTLQQATQQQADDQTIISLTNLNFKLMTETDAGKRFEKVQMAIQALSRDAKEAGGVTPEILVRHVVKNQEDDEVVDQLVAATGALSYEFFSGLSADIERAAMSKDQAQVDRLTAIRTRLLEIYDAMRSATDEMMQQAMALANELANAPDKKAAVRESAGAISEPLLLALEQLTEQARSDGELDRIMAFTEVRNEIEALMQEGMGAQFLMALLQAPSKEEATKLLDENPEMASESLMEMLNQISAEATAAGEQKLIDRIQEVKGMVAAKIAFTQ